VRGRFLNRRRLVAQEISLPAGPQTRPRPPGTVRAQPNCLDSLPRLTYLATRMRRGASCAVRLWLGAPSDGIRPGFHPVAPQWIGRSVPTGKKTARRKARAGRTRKDKRCSQSLKPVASSTASPPMTF